MEFVQVVRSDLMKYIDYVEELIKHHNELEQKHKDLLEVHLIEHATNRARINVLMDAVLDSDHRSEYARGLIDAYNLIKGGKAFNG